MRLFFGSYRVGLWYSPTAFPAKAVAQNGFRIVSGGAAFHGHNNPGLCLASYIYAIAQFKPFVRHISSSIEQQISWESSSATLLTKLETALDDHHIDEAWESFIDYKRAHGFPKQNLVRRLIVTLSYSSDRQWLHRAYDLVLVILEEKSDILHYDSLTRLGIALARAQIPVPTSTTLRIMLEKNKHPPMDIWNTVFFHMTKTPTGSYLASNILFEICECFLHHNANAKNSKRLKSIKPETTLFNLVLNSCMQFGSLSKAQQLIDIMPSVGVVADANTITIISRIYEMSGQREDLRNLEEHICSLSSFSGYRHYQQFYDCLLSLHFKFNDIDGAANLILHLCTCSKSLTCSDYSMNRNFQIQKTCQVQVGSGNLRMGYKMIAKPDQLNDFVLDAAKHSELVIFKDGKLIPSSKSLSKLINACVKDQRVEDLSNILASIHKEMSFSVETSLCSEVIDACVQLGWLETAHDILDNMESTEIPIDYATYISLFRAYSMQNRLKEAKILLKQMKKLNIPINLYNEEAVTVRLQKGRLGNNMHVESANLVKKSCLAELLETENKKDIHTCQLVYELNSSILFFCKAKMMEDAMRTFRKMQERNIQATIQTFSHLVNGYSSLEMYREITILWGEIKRGLEGGSLAADRDLFDCLLLNFIRGGYFERVMEIINYMNGFNMYIDKWKYRREFLKYHRALYRNLKASNARTDAQKKRLEHVQAFRRWAGIGVRSHRNLR